jgi:uncharacterized protein (DUF302 family)
MAAYGFSITLPGTVDELTTPVTEALKAEGFGVLTTIDADKTLKEKIGVDRPPYRILGACNPHLAHQALDREPDIGLLLPCNVVLRETSPGEVVVAFMDPEPVLGLVGRSELAELGAEVKVRLQRVRDALAQTPTGSRGV